MKLRLLRLLSLFLIVLVGPSQWGLPQTFSSQILSPVSFSLPFQQQTINALLQYRAWKAKVSDDAFWEEIQSSHVSQVINLEMLALELPNALSKLEDALKEDILVQEAWAEAMAGEVIVSSLKTKDQSLKETTAVESKGFLLEVLKLDRDSSGFERKAKGLRNSKPTLERLTHTSNYGPMNWAMFHVHDLSKMFKLFFLFLKKDRLTYLEEVSREKFGVEPFLAFSSSAIAEVKFNSELSKYFSKNSNGDIRDFRRLWSSFKQISFVFDFFGKESIQKLEQEFVRFLAPKLEEAKSEENLNDLYEIHNLLKTLLAPEGDFNKSSLSDKMFVVFAGLMIVDAWRHEKYYSKWVYCPHQWTQNLAQHCLTLLESGNPLVSLFEPLTQLSEWKGEEVYDEEDVENLYPHYEEIYSKTIDFGIGLMEEINFDLTPFLLDLARKLDRADPSKQKVFDYLGKKAEEQAKKDPETGDIYRIPHVIQARLKVNPNYDETIFYLTLFSDFSKESFPLLFRSFLEKKTVDEQDFERLGLLWGVDKKALIKVHSFYNEGVIVEYNPELFPLYLDMAQSSTFSQIIEKLSILSERRGWFKPMKDDSYAIDDYPYIIFVREVEAKEYFSKLRGLIGTENETLVDGIVKGYLKGGETLDIKQVILVFKQVLSGIYDKGGVFQQFEDFFIDQEGHFAQFLAKNRDLTFQDLIKFSAFFSMFKNADGDVLNPFMLINLLEEEGMNNSFSNTLRMLEALGKGTHLIRILFSSVALIKHSPGEFDVESFISYVQDMGHNHGPVVFRAYKLIKQLAAEEKTHANKELIQLGLKGKLGRDGHIAINKLKRVAQQFSAQVLEAGELPENILESPLKIDLLRMLVNFDGTHWPDPGEDFNKRLGNFLDDKLAGLINPLPDLFYEETKEGNKKLRLGQVDLHRFSKNFEFLKGAKKKFDQLVIDLKLSYKWSQTKEDLFKPIAKKIVLEAFDKELDGLKVRLSKSNKPRGLQALRERMAEVGQLREAIQRGGKALPILIRLAPKTNSELGRVLRLLLYRQGFLKNVTYARQFRQNFSSDSISISIPNITLMIEFINDIVKQHVLSEFELDPPILKNVRGHLNIRTLKDELNRAEKLKDEETTTLTIVPARGFLAEMSGYYYDSCWTRLKNIMKDNEDLVGFFFVENYDDPKKMRLVGGSLLILTQSGGRETFIIRGLNPQDAIANKYSSVDLVNGFLDYLKTIPLSPGETERLIGVPIDSGARSNRPGVNNVFEKIWGEKMALDKSNSFNGYHITHECRFLMQVETELPHIENLPGSVKKVIGEAI